MTNSNIRAAYFGIVISLIGGASFAAGDEAARKVVIPFDFVSKFDGGRYGEQVADSIWTKLNREGGFILPDSMQEVRDFCQGRRLTPTPDLPLEKMKKIVREDFDAQIGIWGSVERAVGAESDVYDLAIKCVDFSAAGGPKTIYEVKARTKTVSEIPHVYVKAMLDALYGRKPVAPPVVDSLAEEKWIDGPNLVVGGDFESGMGGVPKGWSKTAGQKSEPLGKLVKWTSEQGSQSQYGGNKIVRFTFGAAVGDNEGVMYYSDYFPVEEGAKYRFQCRFRSDGPAVKVFLKCSDETNTEYREENAKDSPLPKSEGRDKNAQRREVYRCQMNLQGPKNTWNTHTEDFTPRHTKYTPRWGRVMLYAYLGAGQVDFDDVMVKQIAPAPSGGSPKELKHSSATKTTLKEMEENERRSKEAKAAEKGERKK
ncbi:MAG: hypothetical protein IT426_01010 [Pirellulales bacterium]|nr:hypothetical protein [Pirellulales bacterium]